MLGIFLFHCCWAIEEFIFYLNQINLYSLLWVLVHVAGAGGIVFVLLHAYHLYSTNPMVTSLHDTLYPINVVPFPGVAVCNNNRISYRAAITLSEQL